MNTTIIFEHPLNERIRTLLRLELLFQQTGHFLHSGMAWENRMMINTLLEILALFARGDLKTELIKELERTTNTLSRHTETPGIDRKQLDSILDRLDKLCKDLHAIKGQLGQALKDDEFLSAIKQRSTIPGGTCDFDLPIYHLWLQQPEESRIKDQKRWFDQLAPVQNVVEFLLKMIRNSTRPTQEKTTEGMFQQSLDSNESYQLIRIGLAKSPPYFAEVSGGKHRFTVRFMEPNPQGRAKPVMTDVPFLLTCCVL
ncbi:MAG: cell division protein ZapD [Gammaproteobacteria bacterium]|nr:cell division protein ZapD [Gammaproteobacteria bacterium]